MFKRIAIIQGHPDPAGHHLCHALADAYATGAVQAGHSLRRIDIAGLDFPLLRSQVEFEATPLPGSLREAGEAIAWAEHFLIVFPLWLGTMPALLKGFLEQVCRPGIVFEYRAQGLPRRLLTGRSARVVVTMGMPSLIYRWYFMAHGLKGLERSVLNFAGVSPVRDSLFGLVANASEAKRRRWINKMATLGARGV